MSPHRLLTTFLKGQGLMSYSSHLVKIPVFFHIAIYIAETKYIAMYIFSNIVQPYLHMSTMDQFHSMAPGG